MPVAIVACALVLLLALGDSAAIYARGAPTRNDRRPDRETRAPRTRPTSNRAGNSRTLRSAAQPTATPSTDGQTPPTSDAPAPTHEE